MQVTLYATFSDAAAAERALAALLDRGGEAEDISALFPPDYGRPDETNQDLVEHAIHGISVTTAADAAAGARKGAAFGLGVGTAVGLMSLLIPGVGMVTGGGALASALLGIGGAFAGGAVAGGVAGYLEDQGVTPEMAVDSEAAVQQGKAVVSVLCPTGELSAELVAQLLTKYGADGIKRSHTP